MKKGKLWHAVVLMILGMWIITQFEKWTLGEVIR